MVNVMHERLLEEGRESDRNFYRVKEGFEQNGYEGLDLWIADDLTKLFLAGART